jgi:hypothetical protein
MLAAWNRLLDGPRFPIEAASIGEIPLVASRILIDRIDARLAALLGWLKPRLAQLDDPKWRAAPAADVLTADLAIVDSPDSELGWDLRWVEIQTFTSLVSTIHTLHCAAAGVWPALRDLRFWGALPPDTDWLQATQRWMAPEPGSILLENDPWSQPTRPDFEAARRWFGVIVTEPSSLRAEAGQLARIDDNGRQQPVPHVANRLILHETPAQAEIESLLSSVSPGWNSHPAWYYAIDKGVMPDLPLPPAERCARGDRWRELDLPAEALVAKQCHSHSGRGVKLHLDADVLDALASPQDWIVQPRFSPAPQLHARDGAPLYPELRCIVALPRNGAEPWLVCRLARMSRSPMVATGNWSGAAGEGAVPVYAPPA